MTPKKLVSILRSRMSEFQERAFSLKDLLEKDDLPKEDLKEFSEALINFTVEEIGLLSELEYQMKKNLHK